MVLVGLMKSLGWLKLEPTSPHGVGYTQVTAYGGRRCSAVDAFITPLAECDELQIRTGARVRRVLIENGRAAGVEYVRAGRVPIRALRRRGARGRRRPRLASAPHALRHRSGGELRALGIDVKADLPGVGRNLQDHCGAPVATRAVGALGYYRQDRGVRMFLNGLQYVRICSGRVATNGVEACSYHVPEDGSGDPVVQIWCVPKTSYIDKDVRGVPDIDE